MSIRWSALRVSEAADDTEELIGEAAGPLLQARIVAREARKSPNLPQYVDDRLYHIISEIDRAIGGSQLEPIGKLKAGIVAVRDAIPEGALEEERARSTLF